MGKWFALGLFATGLFLVAYWASEDAARLKSRRAPQASGPAAVSSPLAATDAAAPSLPEEPLSMPGLSEACQAEAEVAHAAALARDRGEALDVFLRRPLVAWQDDQQLRAKLAQRAREVYATSLAAGAAQRQTAQDCR